MKKTIAIAICVFLFSCKPKPGSLAGNAYWKYNDYVGNKPDAGADVYLFSTDTSKSPLKTTSDVQGNFALNNLAPGKYLLVVSSKATNASSQDQVNAILSFLYDPIIGFPTIKSDQIHRFIESYYGAKRFEVKMEIRESTARDSLNYYRTIARETADSILNELPEEKPFKKWVFYFGAKNIGDDVKIKTWTALSKIKVQTVEIKSEETASAIIDFGITLI